MGINDRFGGTSYTKKKKKGIFPPSRSRWSGIVVVLPLYLFSFWRARTSRRYYFNTHNVDGDRIKSSSFIKRTTAVASQPACGATTMIEPVKTSLWPAVHAHELSSDGGAGVRAMDLIRYVIISKREGYLSRRRCGDDGLSEAAGGDETRKRHRRKDSVREGECRGKGKLSTAFRMDGARRRQGLAVVTTSRRRRRQGDNNGARHITFSSVTAATGEDREKTYVSKRCVRLYD